MKKLMFIVAGVAMIGLLAGCKCAHKGEHPTGEKSAKEQPPKDHPAH